MTYDYHCPQCGLEEERDVPSEARNWQWHRFTETINGDPVTTYHELIRRPHFRQVFINKPAGFMTSKELVMGPPGSKARDEFEGKIRSGEIVPSGPGSRWV